MFTHIGSVFIHYRTLGLTRSDYNTKFMKMRTNKHKKNHEKIEIQDLSYLLTSPPVGTSPINMEHVKMGNVVKIQVNSERFWCVITEVKGDIITGSVNNELVQVPWPVGMKLKFHRNCVYVADELVKTNEPYSRIGNMRLVPANLPP